MYRPDRRRIIRAGASALALPMLSGPVWGVTRKHLALRDEPFQLGVASGDPSSDGFVLWTRLAPEPLNGGGMPPENVEVTWRVATDEAMANVVCRGTEVATPEFAHSVHAEVRGLRPNRWYWYQFTAAGAASPVGRARTFPLPGDSPTSIQFAFASCQHFETGFFTAYEHMAKQELDVMLHLGDYIYEGAARDGSVRRHVGAEIESLDDYRTRHAQYKTDLHLQAAHAAFPWLVTWDDHEFDNNYAAAISEEPDVATDVFLLRRANAYQAFYEHMPLRRSSMPQGSDMRLYRRVPFGQLIDFDVLDTRQYRTDQPCGDGNQAPCGGATDATATLLGDAQEAWLQSTLKRSTATWNCLAQQVMMARVDRQPGDEIRWSMDQWAGYDAARRRLLQFFVDHQISNPVVLTGDIHKNFVNELKIDFDDPDANTVATEFVGTSITSGGDGSQATDDAAALQSENPFVHFYNAERGFVTCRVTEQEWRSDYRVVESVTKPGAPLVTRAAFVVEGPAPGIHRVG